jgi:outer membrane beta-barrel protein
LQEENKMSKCLILAIAGAVLSATITTAANLEGQISVSPLIGGYTYSGAQHLDTSMVYGLRAGYNFTGNIGVEALFDYVHSADSTVGSFKGLSMQRYGGEVLYHFIPDSTFVPYVAVGYAGLNFDGERKLRTVGAFDYGVGAKYFLNDRIALRGDIRHLMYTYDKTNHNIEYSLGAYIPFGVVKPAVKPIKPPPAAGPVPEHKVVGLTPLPPITPISEPESTVQKSSTNMVSEKTEAPLGKIMVTGLNSDNNMIEIQATERIRDYDVFTLTDPSRLVIDIPNAVSGFKQNNFRIDKLGISTVRFESHPEFLRIFLDADQWRILPYRIEESDKILKVIITTP